MAIIAPPVMGRWSRAISCCGSTQPWRSNHRPILSPIDLRPPSFGLVLGFEDMRLFAWRGALWCIATVCELTQEGWRQQVLARIDESGAGPHRLVDWRVLEPTAPRRARPAARKLSFGAAIAEPPWRQHIHSGPIRFARDIVNGNHKADGSTGATSFSAGLRCVARPISSSSWPGDNHLWRELNSNPGT
jgi:hypothetical protein